MLFLKTHSLALARTRIQSIRAIFLGCKEKRACACTQPLPEHHLQTARDASSLLKPLSLVPGHLLCRIKTSSTVGQACGAARRPAECQPAGGHWHSGNKTSFCSLSTAGHCAWRFHGRRAAVALADEGHHRQGQPCSSRLIADEMHPRTTVFSSMRYLDHFKGLCVG